MIYRNGQLITESHKNIKELLSGVQQLVQKDIGAIYKGSLLVWLTIYNAVKSCYGSGTWISDKNWIDDDYWKNN